MKVFNLHDRSAFQKLGHFRLVEIDYFMPIVFDSSVQFLFPLISIIGISTRFLGYFQPQEGKPALWELDSDYYLHVSGIGDDLFPEKW